MMTPCSAAVSISATAFSLRLLRKHSTDLRHLQPTTTTSFLQMSARGWSSKREFSMEQSECRVTETKYEDNADSVNMEYVQGLPRLTVPLPSRKEKCEFTLKPISHKVGDFIEMLKLEDRGIDRATIFNKNGVRIAATCSIDALLNSKFSIQINDRRYEVLPPPREQLSQDELNQLGDIRRIVAQLYEALNVGEYHVIKNVELKKQLEDLKYELQPLEQKKTELSAVATRRTNLMTWVGLGLMSMQFGILARLTWWEYSWDIMEPVTYFVTYGTTMAMYAYYCITKQEYNMPDVKNREYLLKLYKDAKKQSFDIEKYNMLRRRTAEIEYDLKRLQDPLNMQLPPHLVRSEKTPMTAYLALDDSNTATTTTTTSTSLSSLSNSSSSSLRKLTSKLPFIGTKTTKESD